MLRRFKSTNRRFRRLVDVPGGTRTLCMNGSHQAAGQDARDFGVALRGASSSRDLGFASCGSREASRHASSGSGSLCGGR
jgi:hypothetical protein